MARNILTTLGIITLCLLLLALVVFDILAGLGFRWGCFG